MSVAGGLDAPGPHPLASFTSEPAQLSFAEILSDARVMTRRQVRKTFRAPLGLAFRLFQPVLFLLVFGYVLGGAVDTGQVPYIDFLLPGIMVQMVVLGGVQTGAGLIQDLHEEVVDRFRSLPISRSALVIGRTMCDLAVNAAQLAVIFVLGVVMGFRPTGSVLQVATALVIILAFSYAFSWISAFVTLSMPDAHAAQTIGLIWVFPLTFASSAFAPVSSMPGPLQAFAQVNPITPTVDAARALLIGHGDPLPPTLTALGWLILLLVVFVPLTAHTAAVRGLNPPPAQTRRTRAAKALTSWGAVKDRGRSRQLDARSTRGKGSSGVPPGGGAPM